MGPRAKRVKGGVGSTTSKRSTALAADSFNVVLSSRAETESLGRSIGRVLTGGEVLALHGTLGAGKTTLVRGIAIGLGVPSHCVSSPTFILAHEYPGRVPLMHIDLYRVKDSLEVEASGLSDCFTERMVVAVEWADRFPSWLPTDRLELRLLHRSQVARGLSITARGPVASSLLCKIKDFRRRRTSGRANKMTTGRGKASTR